MNIRIVSLAFALASPAFAQEPNPFVKKPADRNAEQPPGPSVFGVLEHILVPPAAIDAWIEANGMPDDATPLREELEKWVQGGNAHIDHTAFLNTLLGRRASSDSILEQIYPTEYVSGGAGVWPVPAAFETRNTGYSCAFEARSLQDGIAFVAESEWVAIQRQHPSWHPLMERTRQPGDVFIPVFDSIHSSSLASIRISGGPGDPFAPANSRKEADPQAWEKGALALGKNKIHWLGRFDPAPTEREKGAMSRLIFFRGAAGTEMEPPPRDTVPERFQFSFKAVRVKHADFSAWLREAPVHTAAMGCWEQTVAWEKSGQAETVDSAGGMVNLSHGWDFQSVRETIYPTEWMPINETTVIERWEKITPAKEGGQTVHRNNTYARKRIEAVPGLGGASLPTSFETRNGGLGIEARFSSDAGAAIAELRISRVRQVGLSTYRRIEVDGEWIPDIQLPLFSSDIYEATCRLLPGRWVLACSSLEYLDGGVPDREHRLLHFVRME